MGAVSKNTEIFDYYYHLGMSYLTLSEVDLDNPNRLIRAIGVYEVSGKKISSFSAKKLVNGQEIHSDKLFVGKKIYLILFAMNI